MTTADLPPQTLVFEFYGVLGLLVQTVVLRVMLRAVGEVYVLLTGLVFETMRLVLLGFAQAKYQARVSNLASLVADLLPSYANSLVVFVDHELFDVICLQIVGELQPCFLLPCPCSVVCKPCLSDSLMMCTMLTGVPVHRVRDHGRAQLPSHLVNQGQQCGCPRAGAPAVACSIASWPRCAT